MPFLSKYGVARHVYIAVPKAGTAAHAVGADWTPAAGDVKISKDGGATANVTNLPVAIAMGNSALWDFSLTATECEAAQIMVLVADSATKAVDDTGFIVETYGHASAQHAFDLDTAVHTDVTAIKAKTDQFVFTTANKVDATLQAAGDFAQAAADKVWASAARTLTSLGASLVQEIWDRATSALTTAGSIGKRIVDNVLQTGDGYNVVSTRLPAALTGDGFIKADTLRIGGTLQTGNDVGADTNEIPAIITIVDNILVDTAVIGVAGAGLTALATQTSVNTLATVVDVLDDKVESIGFDVDDILVDTAVIGAAGAGLTALATAASVAALPTAAVNADAVWDEVLAGHLTAGTTGNALNAAGAAGDPWTTAIPGAYGAGSAGKIIGDNLNATVSSRATPAQVNTEADTAIADAALATAANLALVKAKTDLIPAAPAAVGDVPTALQNADALLKRDMSAVTGEAARSPLNAFRFNRNKFTIVGGVLTVFKEDDVTTAWTATITQTAGDPVSASDPA